MDVTGKVSITDNYRVVRDDDWSSLHFRNRRFEENVHGAFAAMR
jgi:hypothetical protein